MTHKEIIEKTLAKIYSEERYQLSEHGLILHYPEITISNENGVTRPIYDLFVKLIFSFNEHNNIKSFNSSLYGNRTTFTPRDIYHYYKHSHLPEIYYEEEATDEEGELIEPCVDLGDWQNFCLGSDSLAATLSALQIKFEEDKFQILLNLINDFVEWESLEGGPYMLINDIPNDVTGKYVEVRAGDAATVGVTVINIVESRLFDFIKANIDLIDYEVGLHSTFFMPSPEFIEKWESSLLSLDRLKYLGAAVLKYDGKYYQESGDDREVKNRASDIEFGDAVYFKGQAFYGEIKWPEVNNDYADLEAKGIWVYHPTLLRDALPVIQKQFFNYLNLKDKSCTSITPISIGK